MRLECPECKTSYEFDRMGIPTPQAEMSGLVKCVTCGVMLDWKIREGRTWFFRKVLTVDVNPSDVRIG